MVNTAFEFRPPLDSLEVKLRRQSCKYFLRTFEKSNSMKWLIGISFLVLPLMSWGQQFAERHDIEALTQLEGKSIVELKNQKAGFTAVQFRLPKNNILSQKSNRTNFSFQKAMQAAPLVYAYKDLAFFCKLEVQMEKKAKLPIKVRLGEVQYVERMEGKY